MAENMNISTREMFIVKNCGVNCCNSKHYIKFIDGRAIIPAWEMFQIERCWKRDAREKCDYVCPKRNPCREHSLLSVFKFFSERISDRNTDRNDIVSKILIKDNCKHRYCKNNWCFSIYETKYLTEPGTRAKYLQLFNILYLYLKKSTWFFIRLSVCTWRQDVN